MLSFTCDFTQQRVLSRRLSQTGMLTLRTRIEIRGDYQAGPVPVSVIYETCFVPDKEFWERDERCPDEEAYSVSYPMGFHTIGEREPAVSVGSGINHNRDWR
jgi:hypothetical protein